jgi:hypothetical protein
MERKKRISEKAAERLHSNLRKMSAKQRGQFRGTRTQEVAKQTSGRAGMWVAKGKKKTTKRKKRA